VEHNCVPFEVPKTVWPRGWGPAISGWLTDKEGRLSVTNDEYSSPVDFCPWCGFKGTSWPKEKK
jgi:hypothetical protein